MALDKFRKIHITLNKANQRVLETQIAKSGDVNGRELVVQITNNGVIEDQTGTSLKLNWQHENGKQGSTNFNVVDIKTGRFSVYYPKKMLYKGKVNASIEISSNGQITNSMNFKIIVQADVFNGEAGNVDGVFVSLAEVNKKLDDREAEYVELKNRQTSVETQFNSVQQELTDKDVISAPEIIAARDGHSTLNSRLDYIDGDVKSRAVNIKFPPSPMNDAKGDGITDDTLIIKSIFEDPEITDIIIPDGTYIIDPSITIKLVGNKKITANKGSLFKVKDNVGNWDAWLSSTNDLDSLMIDGLNFDSNTEKNVNGQNLDSNNRQYFLRVVTANIERVSITNCYIKSSGVNTIVVNSTTAKNVNVKDNTIVWQSKFPDGVYDNSVIYLNCLDHTIENNKLYCSDGLGKGGIETHWGSGITSGNTIKGFSSGINLTNETHSLGSEEVMSVKDNHILCTSGVTIWSSTIGGTFKNIDVSGNNIYCQNHGVGTYYGTDGIWNGNFENLFIENNRIYYKEGTVLDDASISSTTASITLKSFGDIVNATIKNNVITNPPYTSIATLSLRTGAIKGKRININIDGNIIVNPCADVSFDDINRKNTIIFSNDMSGVIENNKIYNPNNNDGYSYQVTRGDMSTDLIFRNNMIPNNMRIRLYAIASTSITKELRNEYNPRYNIKKYYPNESDIKGVFYKGDIILVGSSEMRVCTTDGAITDEVGTLVKSADGTITYNNCENFPIYSNIQVGGYSTVVRMNIKGNLNISHTITNLLTVGTHTVTSAPPTWKVVNLV